MIGTSHVCMKLLHPDRLDWESLSIVMQDEKRNTKTIFDKSVCHISLSRYLLPFESETIHGITTTAIEELKT